MYIAFKKLSRGLLDKVITWRTGSKYVHVEIVFSNGITWKVQQKDHPAVRWDTSHHPESDWDLVPYYARSEASIKNWCAQQVGKSYDWFGLLNFIFPLGERNDDDLFCSEGVVYALQSDGALVGVRGAMTSPGDLYKILTSARWWPAHR